MKKLCWLTASIVVVTIAVISLGGRAAQARPNYWKVFDEKYVEAAGVDPTFAATLKTTKCYVCHVGKDASGNEDKKNRNDYGKALGKVIKAKEKDAAKIAEALDTVAKEPSSEAGKTFGDLIAAGKLPGK